MKPIFVGLGAAAVLAAGGASAVADTSPPSASDSDPAPSATGELEVTVYTRPTSPEAGEPVEIATTVKAVRGDVADVKIKSIRANPDAATLTGDCVAPYPAAACTVGDGDLSSGDDDVFTWKLTAPEKTKKVEITVTVSAAKLGDIDKGTIVTYVVPTPTKTPTKSPTPTKKPTKPPTKSPSPTATSTTSSGASNGGGGGSNGGNGSGGSGSGGNGAGTDGYVPPSPNSSFDPQNPQVALPSIQAPSPSVAPSPIPGSGTPQSRLQGNKAPIAQDLTFERMASTQIAWLAALMVAFSLLLTQLRLGRRRLPAGAPKRVKGTHRRPRHGMFGN